jgi:hypothetical protein
MARWRRERLSEPLDLDAVLRSAPFGTVDSEIVELVSLATGTTHVSAAPFGSPAPGRFLDATTLVMVQWRDWPHVRIHDGSGRYAAHAPTPGELRSATALRFFERDGVQFTVRPWSAQATNSLGDGKTSGEVVTEMNGATIGTCHQGGERGAGIDVRGHLRGPGNEWVANIVRIREPGQHKPWIYWVILPLLVVIAFMRSLIGREPEVNIRRYVVAGAGEQLARLYDLGRGKTASDREYWYAWVVEFGSDTTHEVQALTLAYVLCEEIQDDKNSAAL